MKIKGEKNCKAKLRNLPEEQPAHLRLEYSAETQAFNVYVYNYESEGFTHCLTYEQQLDYNGIFLVTGASGITNQDHVYLDYFALYNMNERVTE